MSFAKTLSRDEMKQVKAGYRGSNTNCIICPNKENKCKEYDGSVPDEGCSWGTCFCDDPV